MFLYDFKTFILNEMHPGARPAKETIQSCVNKLLDRGIEMETINSMAKLIINVHRKRIAKEPRFSKGSDEAIALRALETCLDTLFDDGYMTKGSYKEFSEFFKDVLNEERIKYKRIEYSK